MICIYCGQDKNVENFSRTEHVIPRCFGSFQDNLTLHDSVCDECNQYFGDNLEIHMGRDSLEGIARYRFGINPKNTPIFRRLRFIIESKNELQGVHVIPLRPSDQTMKDEISALTQVGFYNKESSKYEYFERGSIPSKTELESRGFQLNNKEIFFWGDIESLLKEMNQKGLSIDKSEIKTIDSVKPSLNIPVLVQARIDRVICRGMAKIVFNYVAQILGPAFVNQYDFFPIKRFIRYDEGILDNFVDIATIPILFKERILRKRWHNCHIIIAEWDHFNLIGKLSVFNSIVWLTYIIKLCKNFKGIWYPLKKGHYFDLLSNKIKEISIL